MMACGMSLFGVFFLDCFWVLVFLFGLVMMVIQVYLVVVMGIFPSHVHAVGQSWVVGRRMMVVAGMVTTLRFHQTKAEKKKKSQNKKRTKADEWAFLTKTE